MRFLRPLAVFILGLLLLLFQHCVSTRASVLTKKYSPAELKEDAKLLQNVVMEMHPAVGLYQSRTYYEQLFKSFLNNLNDSLTEKQFRLKTKLVLDELHCGHTELLFSTSYYKQVRHLNLNYSPYVVLPVDNRAFVLANLNKKQDSTLRKGMEIIRINGVGIDSMFRYSKRFISADGYNQTCRDHFLQLGFNSYYPGLFGRPDTFVLEYKYAEKIKELRVPALKFRNFPPLPLGGGEDSLFTRFRRAKINYRFMDEGHKTLVLKIDKFTHTGANKAYRKIFKKLQRSHTENLVLDLRNNGGGSLANSYKLLTYLIDTVVTQTLSTPLKNYPFRKYTRGNIGFKFTRGVYNLIAKKRTVHDTDYFVYSIKPRRKFHYGGKIFLLQNGGSFSASCMVATYLERQRGVIVIGEESGGTKEGCNAGVTPYYRLPNTGLRARIPAFRVSNDVSPQLSGRGIFPDYRIEYSLKDILNRRDLELEKVKELINLPQ